MIDDLKIGVVIPAYNEERSLRTLVPAIPRPPVDAVVVVNDGSTDSTSLAARESGAEAIDRDARGGPGPAIRDGLRWMRDHEIDVVVVMASSGKHDPAQIPRLLRPIVDDGMDFVCGSRHASGGRHTNIPWHRLVLIRLFTLLVSLLLGRRVTDATGGYRAFRMSLLEDERINLDQPWLGRYGLETYLYTRAIIDGHRFTEVPVSVTYPATKRNYTRARPLVDWWGYFRPVVLLRLNLKH